MVGDAPREAETFQAAMSRRADLPRPSGDRACDGFCREASNTKQVQVLSRPPDPRCATS